MKKYILNNIWILGGILLLFSCETDDSHYGDMPDAIINNDPENAPPRQWIEAWEGHEDLLYRQYFDENTVIYFDPEVERPTEWPYQFFSDTWGYVKRHYGNFGEDGTLYTVFHSSETNSFYKDRFDADAGNINLIDLSLADTTMTAEKMDESLSLVGNLVVNSSNGTSGSPGSDIWTEEQWNEIFLYDLYAGLGYEDDAQRIYDDAITSTHNTPVENVNMFADWLYPLYEEYNGRNVLVNFLRISSENFFKQGNEYIRGMNMGEFVHFFSGATGEDLQPMTEEAFGWEEAWQEELLQARGDYPNLNYPFEPTAQLVDLTATASLQVSKDNDDGSEGDEGSLKVIDNDTDSKFLIGGFSSDINFWMEQSFDDAQIVNRYTLTSGNDAPDRDPVNWELQASNDGENWEVLDSRSDQAFSDRNQTREFTVDNETSYLQYRLAISENNGSGLLQISEWRLLSLQTIDPSEAVDYTDNGSLSVNYENGGGVDGAEGSSKLVDGDTETKYLSAYYDDLWVQLEFEEALVINQYTLTSGNDAPDRDPLNWRFEGSLDGENWDILDERSGESWSGRNETREFSANNQQAYRFYRLSITANNGSDGIQISEWRVLGN